MNAGEAAALAVARQPVPAGLPVVSGSTPVVSFGDPTTATVATLGLNPSVLEFRDAARRPLTGGDRRLTDRLVLGVADDIELTREQAEAVIEACHDYFSVNPYRRWFDHLDAVLTDAVGCSYYTGSACHLDLTPWATDPVWGRLDDPQVTGALLEVGKPLLAAQLAAPGLRLVVVNGAAVWRALPWSGLNREALRQWDFRFGARGARATLRLVSGDTGPAFAGWTLNVPVQSRGPTRRPHRAGRLAARVPTLTAAPRAGTSPLPRAAARRSSWFSRSSSSGSLPSGASPTAGGRGSGWFPGWRRR